METQTSPLHSELEPLIAAMGHVLLEVKTFCMKEAQKVYLVVYSAQGISMEDCTQISRVVLPRLEVMLDSRDLMLEVSSPGLERKLHRFEEFMLYEGRRARVLIPDEGWVYGVITQADQEKVGLKEEDNIRILYKDMVRKAQLIYEGEK